MVKAIVVADYPIGIDPKTCQWVQKVFPHACEGLIIHGFAVVHQVSEVEHTLDAEAFDIRENHIIEELLLIIVEVSVVASNTVMGVAQYQELQLDVS